MYKALDIANDFISIGVQKGTPITHMKLHKMLYYAQGWYLATMGQPLFSEEFKKWAFGPVCPPVYNKFKRSGSSPILTPHPAGQTIGDSIHRFLERMWDFYGKYSAVELSTLSHKEDPWLDTEKYEVIPKEKIGDYFRRKYAQYIEKDRQSHGFGGGAL